MGGTAATAPPGSVPRIHIRSYRHNAPTKKSPGLQLEESSYRKLPLTTGNHYASGNDETEDAVGQDDGGFGDGN